MNRAGIDMHQNQRKTFVLIIVLTLALLFSLLILISSQKDEISHLGALRGSTYLFSGKTQECIGQDEYYFFDAGIAFTRSLESETSINADVIMQSSVSDYTESVKWNAVPLGVHEVAITENIARINGLKVGNEIFSKHIVSGSIIAYTIRQVLPEASRVRITEKREFTNGIIIMGYDSLYINHITHSILAFSSEPLDVFSQKYLQTPHSITYRADEIKLLLRQVLPALCIVAGCSAFFTILFVILFAKDVQHYYRRLIMLGFAKQLLITAYRKYLYGAIGISLILYAALSSVILYYLGCGYTGVIIVLCTVVIDILAMLIGSIVCQKQAWRE